MCDLLPGADRHAALTAAEHARDVADLRHALWSLGLLETCEGFDRPPMPCGHPVTSLRRRPAPQRGVECVECRRAANRVQRARARQSRAVKR